MREPCRLSGASRQGSGRGDIVVSRPVDQGDEFFPRRSKRSSLEETGDSTSVRRARTHPTRCGSGSRAAPPAKRFIPSACCCANIWTPCARRRASRFSPPTSTSRRSAVARAGRYPEALLRACRPSGAAFFHMTVRPVKLRRRQGGARSLRLLAHSVLRDPPFSRMDLISCRNLLIYFGAEAQRQVMPIFHYALRRGGYLFLGKSETIGRFSDKFRARRQKALRVSGARHWAPALGCRCSWAGCIRRLSPCTRRRTGVFRQARRPFARASKRCIAEKFAPAACRRQRGWRHRVFFGAHREISRSPPRRADSSIADHGAQGSAPRSAQRAARSDRDPPKRDARKTS